MTKKDKLLHDMYIFLEAVVEDCGYSGGLKIDVGTTKEADVVTLESIRKRVAADV